MCTCTCILLWMTQFPQHSKIIKYCSNCCTQTPNKPIRSCVCRPDILWYRSCDQCGYDIILTWLSLGMINSWNHTFLEYFHGTWGSFGVTMGMLAQLMVHDSCRRLRCFLCPMLVPRWSINLQTDPVSLNQETSNMKQATLKSSIWKLKHIYQSSNWIEHAKRVPYKHVAQFSR